MKSSSESEKENESILRDFLHQTQSGSQDYLIVKQHQTQKNGVERRHFRRFNMRLKGRFMREDETEYNCRIMNISAGGAAIVSDAAPNIGEHIILYLDHIGRAEGKVARSQADQFGICFEISDAQRERLALKISWLVNQIDEEAPDMRRHHRFEANNKETTLVLPGEIEIDCKVENFSLGGASIITTARPNIGAEVMLGRMKGVVVRHHNEGISIEFLSSPTAAYLLSEFGKLPA